MSSANLVARGRIQDAERPETVNQLPVESSVGVQYELDSLPVWMSS
jgi:hypothetical protein